MRILIGIDSGLTGAIAFLRETVEGGPEVHDMPVMAAGYSSGSIKSQVNAAGLAHLLRETLGTERDEALAVLERVDGYIDNKAACFSMGNSFGTVRGVVAALGIPLQVVRAQEWKRYFTLPRDKEHARRKAIELYPQLELNRVKHHNRAEALLIARYGWEQLR